MKIKNTLLGKKRRPLGYTASYNSNILTLRNPWVTAWWSAAFPGFGHITMGIYIKGFILMALIINCDSSKVELIERLLDVHNALGIGKLDLKN
ncbi:MAG TPA: hypothetical protein VF941_08270 [Clostridia bacterium]